MKTARRRLTMGHAGIVISMSSSKLPRNISPSGPNSVAMLKGDFSIDYNHQATPEEPGGEAVVVTMLGPEPNLDCIDRGHPVQLALDSRGLVGMDRIETNSKPGELAVTADVVRRFHGEVTAPKAQKARLG